MVNELTRKQQKNLSEVFFDLGKILEKCIGRSNAIRADKILYKIFGPIKSPIAREFLWKRILNCMQKFRKHTYLFIISEYRSDGHYYFVVKNRKEAEEFGRRCKKMVNAFKFLEKRCNKAVDEKYYLQVRKGNWMKPKMIKHNGKK